MKCYDTGRNPGRMTPAMPQLMGVLINKTELSQRDRAEIDVHTQSVLLPPGLFVCVRERETGLGFTAVMFLTSNLSFLSH